MRYPTSTLMLEMKNGIFRVKAISKRLCDYNLWVPIDKNSGLLIDWRVKFLLHITPIAVMCSRIRPKFDSVMAYTAPREERKRHQVKVRKLCRF